MGIELNILVGLGMGICVVLVLVISLQLIKRGAELNSEMLRQRREVGLVRKLLHLQRRNAPTTGTTSAYKPRFDASLERLIETRQFRQAEKYAREQLALAHDANDEHRDDLYRDYLARIRKIRLQ